MSSKNRNTIKNILNHARNPLRSPSDRHTKRSHGQVNLGGEPHCAAHALVFPLLPPLLEGAL